MASRAGKKGSGNSRANAVARREGAGKGWANKYDPRFCEVVIRMGAEGASETEMAVYGCGVVRATMRMWAKKATDNEYHHPEFTEALAMANELSRAWWENKGRRSLTRQGFNTNLWTKIVSSRFRDEYSDRTVVAGDADAPLVTSITRRIIDPKERA